MVSKNVGVNESKIHSNPNNHNNHKQVALFAVIGFGLIIVALFLRLTETVFQKRLWIGTIILLVGYIQLFIFSVLAIRGHVTTNVADLGKPKKQNRDLWLRTSGHAILFGFFALALVFHITHSYPFYDFFAVFGHAFVVVGTYWHNAWVMKTAVILLALHYGFGAFRKLSLSEIAHLSGIIQLVARSAITVYYVLSISSYGTSVVV
jgi:hypothetical protein